MATNSTENPVFSPQSNSNNTDRKMQIVSLIILFAVAIPLVAFPEAGKDAINSVFKWMTHSFDFAFLGIGLGALIFLLALAFSNFGNVKLSADNRLGALLRAHYRYFLHLLRTKNTYL